MGNEADRKEQSAQSNQSKNKKAKYTIDIFRAWCKSCGICAAFCPRKCIEMDENNEPIIVAPEKCTGCGWCETHCPDFAISVRPVREPRIEAI